MRRAIAVLVAGTLIVSVGWIANATPTSVQEAFQARRELLRKIEDLHQLRLERRVAIHRKIHAVEARLHEFLNATRAADQARIKRFEAKQQRFMRSLSKQEQAVVRSLKTRVASLRAQRESLMGWLDTYGIFRRCPVAGPHVVNDDFGVMVNKPGVPVHVHQGNDIMAAYGTPIVAPFDGTAVATPNTLGGLAVKVFGARGYVYNAHLSSYGHLGAVSTGTVIGYVGATGDAGSNHDHFEWHPGGGSAVDPNFYLSLVC
jgi:murein DD-endopeptidase MepM/ murein hydrolase activator NlpD